MISQISAEQAAHMFETYEPRGCFFVVEADGAYTGIDNSTGHAWTEEFRDFAKMIMWLMRR